MFIHKFKQAHIKKTQVTGYLFYKAQLRNFHWENMSVKCVPPHTPLLCSKTGVCMGVPIFFLFLLRGIVDTRWNRLAEAVLACTYNLCVEQE